MDNWAVSAFRLLWIILLRTWVYKYLFQSLLFILLGHVYVTSLSCLRSKTRIGWSLDLNTGLLMPGPGIVWWQFILSLTQTHSRFWSDCRKTRNRGQEPQDPFTFLTPRASPSRWFTGCSICMKVCWSGNEDSLWYSLPYSPNICTWNICENQSSGEFLWLDLEQPSVTSFSLHAPHAYASDALIWMWFIPQEEISGRQTAGWLTLI